jgi:hypothetical protein
MKLAGSQEDYEKWMAMLPLVDKVRMVVKVIKGHYF